MLGIAAAALLAAPQAENSSECSFSIQVNDASMASADVSLSGNAGPENVSFRWQYVNSSDIQQFRTFSNGVSVSFLLTEERDFDSFTASSVDCPGISDSFP